MEGRYDKIHGDFLLVTSALRGRIQAIRDAKTADSLALAFLDAELASFERSFHTLSEAIEDMEIS